jgi:outer membrane protein OmpA-like peptidoglycan-associated protein
MMRKIASLAALAALAVGPAFAQSNPSAAQLISSLTPTGTVSTTTRGIRPLAPGGNGPTMAPMASMASMSSPFAKSAPAPAPAPSANLDIEFQTGSAALTPAAVAELNQLGEALTSKTLTAYNFQIIGHTDTVGAPDTNKSLSVQRAAAVAKYLETQFKVPGTRLQAEGVGESDLLVPTPPQTPELRNRRVEIVNLGAK